MLSCYADSIDKKIRHSNNSELKSMKKIVDINTIIHNAALEGGIFNIKPLNTI